MRVKEVMVYLTYFVVDAMVFGEWYKEQNQFYNIKDISVECYRFPIKLSYLRYIYINTTMPMNWYQQSIVQNSTIRSNS